MSEDYKYREAYNALCGELEAIVFLSFDSGIKKLIDHSIKRQYETYDVLPANYKEFGIIKKEENEESRTV